MKPVPFALFAGLAAMAILGLGGVGAAPAMADDTSPPAAPAAPAAEGERIVVLILTSDTNLGPNRDEADIAAKYYCAERGKLSRFVAKERPPEYASQVKQQWSLLSYHCVAAGAN